MATDAPARCSRSTPTLLTTTSVPVMTESAEAKVSSPTGRKTITTIKPSGTIMGHSHVPNISPGVVLHGTKTGRWSGKVPQYNTGPSAWGSNPCGEMILGDVHAISVWDQELTADEIVAIYNQGGAANIFDFAEAELRIAQAMFGDGMCGDCIRVRICKEHDPMTSDRRVCPLCETVWPGAEPGNRRREAVEATRAARTEAQLVG